VIDYPGHDYPPTINDAGAWKLAQQVAAKMLGESQVLEIEPTMGGEDFAYYTEQVPGCFVGLGVRNEAEGAVFGPHHPRFKVDEDALATGVALHVGYALATLAEIGS
jgi:metal-dependent amidase/aminoacylase/carboxypeptidase family protein